MQISAQLVLLALPALAPNHPAAFAPRQAGPPAADQEAAPVSVSREDFIQALHRRLGRHSFFRGISYKEVPQGERLLFLVQRPLKDYSGYEENIAARHAPWFEELQRIFEEDYVAPQSIRDNGTQPVLALAVLASQGDYGNYAEATRSRDLYAALAHYDPELRVAITYEKTFNRQAGHIDRRPILHEFVHVLEHAHHADVERMPTAPWFNEGLAEYLSFHLDQDPSCLRKHELDRGAAEDFLRVLRRRSTREVYVRPISEIVRLRGYEDVVQAAFEAARTSGAGFNGEFAMQVFYRQAYLLVHFLHHGEQGVYRDRFVRFVGLVLGGKSSEQAFAEAFDRVDTALLDRQLDRYVHAALGEEVGVEAAASEAGAPAERAVDLSGLVPGPEAVEARLALALAHVQSGRAEEAAAVLESIESAQAPEALNVALQRERGRVRAWIDFRNAYLLALAKDGGTLLLGERDGRELRAAVTAVEGDRVLLGENELGIEQLALNDLRPLQLIESAGSSSSKFGPRWLRLYPYCIEDHPKSRTLLSADRSEETRQLREDATDLYARLLPEGRAVQLLADLQAADVPTDPGQAHVTVERLRALMARHGELDMVRERRMHLRQLAAVALEQIYSTLPLEDLVHGRLERLDGERVRLTYDFGSGEQATDFVRDPRALSSLREAFPEVTFPDERLDFLPREGGLEGYGATASRFILELAAPIKLSYRVTWRQREGQPTECWNFVLGLCVDSEDNGILVLDTGTVFAVDQRGDFGMAAPARNQSLSIGRTYEMRVEHSGDKVEVFADGVLQSKTPTGPLQEGAIVLWLQSDMDVTLDDCVVEGSIGPRQLELARTTWIGAELARMGLDQP